MSYISAVQVSASDVILRSSSLNQFYEIIFAEPPMLCTDFFSGISSLQDFVSKCDWQFISFLAELFHNIFYLQLCYGKEYAREFSKTFSNVWLI